MRGQQRVLAHPDQMRLELVGDLQRRTGGGEHVPAGHVQLRVEPDHHGPARQPFGDRTVTIGHGLDRRGPAGGQHAQGLTGPHGARGHPPAIGAAARRQAHHALHRHAERRIGLPPADGQTLKRLQQGRALIPGHQHAAPDDLIPGPATDRNGDDGLYAQLSGEGGERLGDRPEHGFVAADAVHLGHRQNDRLHAQQGDQMAVSPGLGQQPLFRINQNDGDIGVRGPGHHVARELLMARRVDGQEGAARGGERAIGHIDGDALFPLGHQAVDQGGVVGLSLRR